MPRKKYVKPPKADIKKFKSTEYIKGSVSSTQFLQPQAPKYYKKKSTIFKEKRGEQDPSQPHGGVATGYAQTYVGKPKYKEISYKKWLRKTSKGKGGIKESTVSNIPSRFEGTATREITRIGEDRPIGVTEFDVTPSTRFKKGGRITYGPKGGVAQLD